EFTVNVSPAAPMLTALIPVRDANLARLKRCLQGLMVMNQATSIVISDYGSSAGYRTELESLASEYKARISRTETDRPWSKSAAINHALSACQSEWFLICDADTIVDPKLFSVWAGYHSQIGDDALFVCEPLRLTPAASSIELSVTAFP